MVLGQFQLTVHTKEGADFGGPGYHASVHPLLKCGSFAEVSEVGQAGG
jgi:hypothetical protein